MSQTETLYILELKIPDEDSQRIPVQGRVTVGSSPEANISLKEFGLAPLHCNFRDNNEILTVQNTGGDGAVVVGKQKLGHGKMYIVDKGDAIKLGDLTFIIRTEEAELHYVDDDGHTLAGSLTDVIDDESEDKKTKSVLAKITGLFRKKKDVSEEGDIDIEEDESSDDGPVFDVIDHTNDSGDISDDDTAPRTIKASGASIGKQKPKKVRVSPFMKERRAGFLIRFFGFTIDLALVYSIYLYALPLLKIEKHLQKGFDLLAPYLDKVLPHVQPHVPENILATATNYTTLKILFIFLAFILISNIFLGVNAGLFLIGATGHGGFIGKRIKSLIRTLIGFVTNPFIIFDLPALLKKRTLKEVLSHSQIEKRSNFLSFILGLVITPTVILAAFLWPLINDPILLKMPEFEIAPKATKKSKKEHNTIAMSRHLNMKIAFFKKKTIEFIPAVEKTGIKLHAIDTKRGNKASIFYAKEIDLNPEFKSMLEKNPFLPSFSPSLYKFMSEQKDSKPLTDELASLVKDSMGLTAYRTHEVLLQHGPYINGIMDIRLKLIKSLGITGKFKATLFTVSRKPSLLIEEENTNKIQRAYVIPLGKMKLTPLIIQFDAKSRVLANNIIQTVLMKAGRLPKAFEFDANLVENWNAFTVLDFLASKNKENISEEVVTSVVSFYEGKIAVLKAPEGVSAKSKRSYERLIRSSLKKTSASLKGSILSDELSNLMEQLPEVKVKK